MELAIEDREGDAVSAQLDPRSPEWLELVQSETGVFVLLGTPPSGTVGDHLIWLELSHDQGHRRITSFIATVRRNLGVMTYAKWDTAHRGSGEALELMEDPDEDGLSNLLEFALGGHPRKRDGTSRLIEIRSVD